MCCSFSQYFPLPVCGSQPQANGLTKVYLHVFIKTRSKPSNLHGWTVYGQCAPEDVIEDTLPTNTVTLSPSKEQTFVFIAVVQSKKVQVPKTILLKQE